MLVGQCATSKDGCTFMNNPSVRNAMTLFESFPRQGGIFGKTPFMGVNAYDTCPCGSEDDDGEIIICCPIWIIIIAMERGELITIFAKYAKMLGARLFLGSIGGTSTGVHLLFQRVELSYFDEVVKKVTHITNASTPRYRKGWGWPDKNSQTVCVTNYYKNLSERLVKFCKLGGVTLDRTPLQCMIDHEEIRFVQALSQTAEDRWVKRRNKIRSGAITLSPDAINARIASGAYRMSGDWLRKVCSVEGCTNLKFSNGVCTLHGAVRTQCSVEGCTNQAKVAGVCFRHGAVRTQCSVEGCTSHATVAGRRCQKHGAQECSVEGCTNKVRSAGVCVRHGAVNAPKKQCSVEGCTSEARRAGRCYKHGAARGCSVEGCTSKAKIAGRCYKHGKL